MSYTIYDPKDEAPDLEPIHTKLKNAKVEYTENKVDLISASIQGIDKEKILGIDLISAHSSINWAYRWMYPRLDPCLKKKLYYC